MMPQKLGSLCDGQEDAVESLRFAAHAMLSDPEVHARSVGHPAPFRAGQLPSSVPVEKATASEDGAVALSDSTHGGQPSTPSAASMESAVEYLSGLYKAHESSRMARNGRRKENGRAQSGGSGSLSQIGSAEAPRLGDRRDVMHNFSSALVDQMEKVFNNLDLFIWRRKEQMRGAVKPEDWDEEEDGEWEIPYVMNSQYESPKPQFNASFVWQKNGHASDTICRRHAAKRDADWSFLLKLGLQDRPSPYLGYKRWTRAHLRVMLAYTPRPMPTRMTVHVGMDEHPTVKAAVKAAKIEALKILENTTRDGPGMDVVVQKQDEIAVAETAVRDAKAELLAVEDEADEAIASLEASVSGLPGGEKMLKRFKNKQEMRLGGKRYRVEELEKKAAAARESAKESANAAASSIADSIEGASLVASAGKFGWLLQRNDTTRLISKMIENDLKPLAPHMFDASEKEVIAASKLRFAHNSTKLTTDLLSDVSSSSPTVAKKLQLLGKGVDVAQIAAQETERVSKNMDGKEDVDVYEWEGGAEVASSEPRPIGRQAIRKFLSGDGSNEGGACHHFWGGTTPTCTGALRMAAEAGELTHPIPDATAAVEDLADAAAEYPVRTLRTGSAASATFSFFPPNIDFELQCFEDYFGQGKQCRTKGGWEAEWAEDDAFDFALYRRAATASASAADLPASNGYMALSDVPTPLVEALDESKPAPALGLGVGGSTSSDQAAALGLSAGPEDLSEEQADAHVRLLEGAKDASRLVREDEQARTTAKIASDWDVNCCRSPQDCAVRGGSCNSLYCQCEGWCVSGVGPGCSSGSSERKQASGEGSAEPGETVPQHPRRSLSSFLSSDSSTNAVANGPPELTGLWVFEAEEHDHTPTEEEVMRSFGQIKQVAGGGTAHGAWHGGWWLALLGQNLHAGAKGGAVASVGSTPCIHTLWLSETLAACHVPRGMGWSLGVTLNFADGSSAFIANSFSYDPPTVESFHPQVGPPRGGFWVTLSGHNFGYTDVSPIAAVHGTACMESFWVSDSSILCRSQGGVGGLVGKRHDKRGAAVDVMMRPAVHVQAPSTLLKRLAYFAPSRAKRVLDAGGVLSVGISAGSSATNVVASTPGSTSQSGEDAKPAWAARARRSSQRRPKQRNTASSTPTGIVSAAAGVGIDLSTALRIKGVEPGIHGAHVGDVIIRVSGEDVRGAPVQEVVDRLSGAEGSTVDVTVERQGEEQSFTLVRRFVSRRVHSGDAPEQATAGVHAA